jgi:hypothetical protein
VAGCCECGDEPSDSCATELVSLLFTDPGANSGVRGPRPTTNGLSHGTANSDCSIGFNFRNGHGLFLFASRPARPWDPVQCAL